MSLLGSIKRTLNIPLARLNHAIVHEAHVATLERFVQVLRRDSVVPKTIIDVGVASGTPWLYEGFPPAKFHLVDPTRESLPHMQAWAKKLNAEIHNVALGTSNGTVEIAMRNTIIHASFMQDIGKPRIVDKYQVPVTRFDALFPFLERPVLCKIDVEGAEMMVLEGMGEQVHALDAIVIETSMISLYDHGPEFRDVVTFLSKQGFSFYDFGGVTRRPYDGALHQIDAIFVPDQSPLRIRRWE
jgi:FkbM family methyltransferase